jgi:hypothetical protein
MTCETCRAQLVDRLAGALPAAAMRAVEDHLATCPGCGAEASDLDAGWQALGTLPTAEPGPAVRQRFDAFLAAAEAQTSRPRQTLAARLAFLWPRQPAFQAALVALALVGGFALGTGGRRAEIGELRSEVRSLHHMVALSLLERDSASERLRGVSFTESADSADPAVTAALLDAVRSDPSVNVRLAAIDALASRAGRAPVRRQLLQALAAESSPLVQVAIADAVLGADGAEARRELARTVGEARLDPKVKDYLARRLREEA